MIVDEFVASDPTDPMMKLEALVVYLQLYYTLEIDESTFQNVALTEEDLGCHIL